MLINPGDKIPLNALIADFATTKFVRAFLYRQGAAFDIPIVDLTHIAIGEYQDNSVVMPDERIYAVYRVYDDMGFTTPSSDYLGGVDVFSPSTSVDVGCDDIGGGGGHACQEILGEIAISEVEAEVQSNELSAEIIGGELTVSIEASEETGEIDTSEISAETGETDIDGEAGC